MKNDIVRLGLTLMAFTALAALALGGINMITEPKIAAQKAAEELAAQQAVLSTAASFVDQTGSLDGLKAEYPDVQAVFTAVDVDGNPAGMVIKVAPKGYGGAISIMVGISQDGKISGVRILSHSETPGLGANAEKPEFTNRLTGKSAEEQLVVVKGAPANENEVQAITAATITSTAVTNGVNQAIKYFADNAGR